MDDSTLAELGANCIPFSEDEELWEGLEYVQKECQLRTLANGPAYLPGQPRVSLNDPSQLVSYCYSDLYSPDFENISWWLKVFLCSTPILSLSTQRVHGRQIVPSENPSLHCVWDSHNVFIKPLPQYLLSHAWWLFIADVKNPWLSAEERVSIIASASGLLQTYGKLILYESDYLVALEKHLLQITISFPDLVNFLKPFADSRAPDMLPPRYAGEYQLRTLNVTSLFALWKPYYRLHRNQYNASFSPYFGPVLFVFATFSVALSAMQVALAVRAGEAPVEGTTEGGLADNWSAMGKAFRWFSLAAICFAGTMGTILLFMFYSLVIWDSRLRVKEFTIRKKKRSRSEE